MSRTALLQDAPDLLASLSLDGGGFAWLHEDSGIVTSGVAGRIPIPPGTDRFQRASEAVMAVLAGVEVHDRLRLPGTGPIAVGALPFSDEAEGELIVPATVVGRTPEGTAWITHTAAALATGDPFPATGQAEASSSAERAHSNGQVPSRYVVDGGGPEPWRAAVSSALELIGAGELAKVVLARQVVVDADGPLDPGLVLARLHLANRSCYAYGSGGFVGASPELLVQRRRAQVSSHPMGGSAQRGTGFDDDERAAQLASSAKELTEHALVVDAVREALGPLCVELHAESRPEVVRLSTVAHLATAVRGLLRSPLPSVLDLVGRLHPTPAVAGTPRPDALAAIARLESFDRGRYAGPVGWVDSRGDGDWAVALRCADIKGSRARITAGAGIVAGSQAEHEWHETGLKLEPVLHAVVRP